MSENEGAKFWLSVLTVLKTRGVQDILIACVDGLKGFPDAITVELPHTRAQLCIDRVRNSLRYVSRKDYQGACKSFCVNALGFYEYSTCLLVRIFYELR